jgi:acyl-[acyl-carrier-protein]-phospholipid O-acyltransferase/long-chain-fatty-acid--[acyl-carrier-protein] ligase
VLLTQEKAATRDTLLRHAKLKGAPELSVPADIMIVDSVPLLGSGKPDYVAAKELALKRATPAAEASTVAA